MAKPKRNGSGKGVRANQNKGGCKTGGSGYGKGGGKGNGKGRKK